MSRTVLFFYLFVVLPEALFLSQLFHSDQEDVEVHLNTTEEITHSRRKRKACDCVCGVPSTHVKMNIRGGKEAAKFEFPWLVSIWLRDGHHSSGTIITSRHVITTAHSVYGIKVAEFNVIAGMHSLVRPTGMEQYRMVSHIAFHKQFNPDLLTFDIAVIKLQWDFNWSGAIRPACLPFSEHYEYFGLNGVVAGWGKETSKGPRSKILHKVSVPILENDDCAGVSEDHWKKVEDSMMCAGYQDANDGPCVGDNGSPLHVSYTNGFKEVVGLVSWGYERCENANYPSVYTKITSYLKWIDQRIGNHCRCTARP